MDESASHSERSINANAEPRKYDVKGPNVVMIKASDLEIYCGCAKKSVGPLQIIRVFEPVARH